MDIVTIVAGAIVLCFVGTAVGCLIECFDTEEYDQLDEHATMHYDDSRDHRI